MRRLPPVPRRASFVRLLSGILVAAGLALTTISAQIPGRNVNMVAGKEWPDGDPFLQRQNEPSIAASTRNPLHLLAGANDYRTVDLPGLPTDETGDAWLGLFKSFDGGQRWTSTLLPGYPQDTSAVGKVSPIHGYGAGADAVVRAGTNGLIYYAGLAFDRADPAAPEIPGKSAIFVARFIDNNNKEAGDTFAYLGTRTMQTSKGGRNGDFLDKPWMAVDIPRDNTRCTIVTPGEKGPITQTIPAGPVYVAYTVRSTDKKGARYDIMFSRSVDCANSWSDPVRLNAESERTSQGATIAIDPRNGHVYIAWRQFDLDGTGTDAMVATKYVPTTRKIDPPGHAKKFAKQKKGKGKGINTIQFYQKGGVNAALEAAQLSTLDQSTSALAIRFRTNAYPSMTVDETGRVYMVWAERGFDLNSPDPETGSARVVIATSTNGQAWTPAVPVSNENQKGHQLMPAINYAGGKLMLIYYDIRETRAQAFTRFIDDRTAFTRPNPESTGLRHTIDLRASMASPGANPVFLESVKVSEYIEGPRVPGGPNVPWQVNPPNLPMFQRGTAPFIGDYIDLAAAPNFVFDTATDKWVYNSTAGATPPVFHAAWTDNRDVRPPLEDRDGDGNPWNDYTPPGNGGTPSIFDPSSTVPQCIPGNAGSRNQNIYTARITGGLLAGSPGNTKRLGFRPDNPTQLLQRSFVVFVQNTDTAEVVKRFRLTIVNQPQGGSASFDQFVPLTAIDVELNPRSTASRTVYATSTDPHAMITVQVQELMLGSNNTWLVKQGGLGSAIILNPDIDNPDIDNPDIDNPDIDNPDIDNAEVYNPDIDNPDIDNPDIDNPDIDNPDIDNPDIDNIQVANPDIDNPDIDNPDIDNPDIDNPDIDNPDIDNPDIDNQSLMTDVSWSITNTGNTTAAYNVNLFFAQTTFKPEISTQLILYRTYKTPVVQNCVLKSETRNVLVANVPNPQLVKSSTGQVSDPNDPSATNATIYLAPGESARITLRVFDPNPDPAEVVTVTNADGSTAKISSLFVPNEDVTPVVQQQSVDTADVDEGVTEPPIVVQFPAPQAVEDTASTAENTAVKLNPLANDSTAFGSTKIISFHPAGMASHSGGTPGPDITYQSSTGFLYTGRAAIDPNTNTLVGRFSLPPTTSSVAMANSQVSNLRTGINYGRVPVPDTTAISAFDTRPDSPTFHTFLPMPAIAGLPLGMALDATHGRLYVAHGPAAFTPSAATTVSVFDVVPGSATFHSIIKTVDFPLGMRAQGIAVNSRTQKVYVATTASTNIGGVYTFDGSANTPAPVRVPNTSAAWGLVINEAANLVFASSSVANVFQMYVIDGVSNALTIVPAAMPMRFGSNDERMVVHEPSGKVFMRLEHQVAILDGQRSSPTFGTFIGAVNVGREGGVTDIAVDQELGLVVTTGNVDFQVDIIDVATNALTETIPMSGPPTDIAIDPLSHRAFVSTSLTYIQEIDLVQQEKTDAIPIFVESGGVLLNPASNKAYVGLFTTTPQLVRVSGAGFEGPLPDPGTLLPAAGRFLFGSWHNASNKGFIVNMGNPGGTGLDPGSVVIVDGATDSVEMLGEVPPNPFGIGIDQDTGKVFVGTLSGPGGIHGTVVTANANDLGEEPIAALGPGGNPLPSGFNLSGAGALLGFGRHIVPNPQAASNKVYVTQVGGSPVSLAVLDPALNRLTPLDGQAGTPIFDLLNSGACGGQGEPVCATYGRAAVIRVDRSLNRVFVGYQNVNNYTIVVLDGATDTVLGTVAAGGHSNRHTASYIAVNEAADEFYVTDYANNNIRKFSSATLAQVGAALAIPGGPSALAHNAAANRIYVSSVDTKTLTAIDASTLQVISTVQLPLVAYFLTVDEVESRIYTSGGDSMDESGTMVVTDVLGELGTDVSVTEVGSAQNGNVILNADNSVTYTPEPGFSGQDQFTYTIAAPTGTAIGTVKINVVASTPAILAFSDGYQLTTGQVLNVPAPGPMANDSAVGTLDVTMEPEHGALVAQADGQFTYTPDPEHVGSDSFQYHVVTAAGSSNTVTVRLNVMPAASFVVTNTNNTGAGSLRAAITAANLTPNSTITFNISGSGPHTIAPTEALPQILSPTAINGYSQPGASMNTGTAPGSDAVIKVRLVGTSIPVVPNQTTHGLSILGGGTTVQGLAIGGWTGSGVNIDSAGGNVIAGNFIGTDDTGSVSSPNGTGITVATGGNMIGGNTAGARNVISGNTGRTGISLQARHLNGVLMHDASGTVIKGNLIGANRAGTGALPNSVGVHVSAPYITIGGITAAERNIISGNNVVGITGSATTYDPDLTTNGNGPLLPIVISTPDHLTVTGNYIGVSAGGTAALANTFGGISVYGESSAITNNVISGNGGQAISVTAQIDTSVTPSALRTQGRFTTITGNTIGLNAAGTAPVANGSGIFVVVPDVTIGGSQPGARNVIAGNNGTGIQLATTTAGTVTVRADNTTISGNYIGVAADGTTPAANTSNGVLVGTNDNTIGGSVVADGNRIANNAGRGVAIQPSGVRNRVLSNEIFSNNSIGIDLDSNGVTLNDAGDGDTGANNRQNFPLLTNGTQATVTQVTIDTSSFAGAPGGYTIQFFANAACDASGNGEGRRLVGHRTGIGVGSGIVINLDELVGEGETITATATDPDNNTSEFSPCLPVGNPLEVINTSDSGLGSLRSAITYANSAPGTQTITFNVPGAGPTTPAQIVVGSPLPPLTESVVIDGSTQPGWDGLPVVDLRGTGSGTGLYLQASGVTIRGLAINSFNQGILASGAANNAIIENNVIGSDRFLTSGIGNNQGISFSGSSSQIRNNAIVANIEGLIVINGASSNTILNNGIGTSVGGANVLGNSWNGVVLYNGANNNVFLSNFISGNLGFGVDMQHSGALAQVANTSFWSNTIGLNASAAAAPNGLGGIHVNNAPNTQIGGDSSKRNYISGNTGHGVLIEGGNLNPAPVVSFNYIGLNPGGSIDLGNTGDGVHVGGVSSAIVSNNVISGNDGNGVHVSASGASPIATIIGNLIGVNRDGTGAVGNGNAGIRLTNAAADIGGPNVTDRNVIAGNSRGIAFANSGSTFNSTVRGNYIGTGPNGTEVGMGHPAEGILVSSAPGTRIGGPNAGDRNYIVSNNSGITVNGVGQAVISGLFSTLIQGNSIGVRPNAQPAGNGTGIAITAPYTLIGSTSLIDTEGNIIANSSGRGISIAGEIMGNRIGANSIYGNTTLGIDLNNNGPDSNDVEDFDTGANGTPNYASIVSAVTNNGTTTVTFDPAQLKSGFEFLFEFYSSPTCHASGYGEGQTFRGAAGANGGGPTDSITMGTTVPVGHFMTLTTTGMGPHTSEFSACVQVTGPAATPQVTSVDPGATFGSGQMITINGSNFNIAGPQDVIINLGNVYYPASSIFYNSATKIIARTDQFMPAGPGNLTIRTQNGMPLSTAFNVNVQATPVAPNFITVRNGNCSGYGGPGDTPTTWSGNQLLLVASGIDTTGTRVYFTPSGGGASTEASVLQNCAWAEGDAAVHVQVPALAVGSYDITIRTTVGGNQSANSNAKTLNVAEFIVNGAAGGAANGNCGTCTPPAPGPFGPQLFGLIPAGQTLNISASGDVNNGGQLVGPAGSGPCSECLDPSLPRTALVGRWSSGNWFVIGTGGQFTNPGAADYLQLAINDRDYTDNAGQFALIISPQ